MTKVNSLNGKRALVLEDDMMILGVIERFLSLFGMRIETALSLQQANDCFDERPDWLDLLWTDLNLPDGSGLDFARRARESRPNIKILVCSGVGDKDTVTERVGPDHALLPKPFTLEQAEQALFNLFGITTLADTQSRRPSVSGFDKPQSCQFPQSPDHERHVPQ